MFAGGVYTLAALVSLQVFVLRDTSNDWRWSLFAWGLVVGLVGALCLNASISLVVRLDPPDSGEAVFVHRRRLIYTWAWLFMGGGLAIVSAMFHLVWLVIAMAGYQALVFGAGVIVVTRKARGLRHSSGR